jgi:hypothetical protein
MDAALERERCCEIDGKRPPWCPECGGDRYGPLLGVAHNAAAHDAERLYQQLRAGPLAPEWPGTLDQARGRMEQTGKPNLTRWLAERYQEQAAKTWSELVEHWVPMPPARRLPPLPSYVSLASAKPDGRERVCRCDACERDGQHAPMCTVHSDEVRCTCGKVDSRIDWQD